MGRIEIRHEDYFGGMMRNSKALLSATNSLIEITYSITKVSQDGGVDNAAADVRQALEELKTRHLPELNAAIRRLR